MTDHFEAKVIKAISETMTCNKCPCPCITKQSSTMYDCAKRWSYILSQIDAKSDWKEVLDEVHTLWSSKRHNLVTYCTEGEQNG